MWLQERDAPAASPPVIPASPNKTPQATPQPSGLPLSPRKRNGFRGLFLFCSRRDVSDIIRPPPRAPAAGRQQSPAQPGAEIRSPSALPRGSGGAEHGGGEAVGTDPPPVGEAARRRCWIRDAPSSCPDPPPTPRGPAGGRGSRSQRHPRGRDPPSRPVTRQGRGEEDGPG